MHDKKKQRDNAIPRISVGKTKRNMNISLYNGLLRFELATGEEREKLTKRERERGEKIQSSALTQLCAADLHALNKRSDKNIGV